MGSCLLAGPEPAEPVPRWRCFPPFFPNSGQFWVGRGWLNGLFGPSADLARVLAEFAVLLGISEDSFDILIWYSSSLILCISSFCYNQLSFRYEFGLKRTLSPSLEYKTTQIMKQGKSPAFPGDRLSTLREGDYSPQNINPARLYIWTQISRTSSGDLYGRLNIGGGGFIFLLGWDYPSIRFTSLEYATSATNLIIKKTITLRNSSNPRNKKSGPQKKPGVNGRTPRISSSSPPW